jgi:hypothetical protein
MLAMVSDLRWCFVANAADARRHGHIDAETLCRATNSWLRRM